MIQKKICMLGTWGVGKTSLVRQFVEGIFDERYLTTLGVKIDRKTIDVNGQELKLMLWDVAGSEEYFSVPMSYVRGASGCLLVMDGTRAETIEGGKRLIREVEKNYGALPKVVLLNKADLVDQWVVGDQQMEEVGELESPILKTSAKTGQNVDQAFQTLAEMLIQ